MKDLLSALPPGLRWPLLGSLAGGVLGALTGLILGLIAYPPTAWFAVVEVGLPCAALGFWIALAVYGLTRAFKRVPK